MPALTAQQLRKSYGSYVVLEDASFSLMRRERVALIGANGAGKSTLARILAGLEPPDAGTVSVRRGLTVRYLAQEPELDPGASARDVVESALAAWKGATERHATLTRRLAQAGTAPAENTAAWVDELAELDETITRLGGWERGHEALGFLDRLGVRDVDRPCAARSGGERRRIAIAQLLVSSPDVAILDEPTNHLDADTAAWLEAYLARDFRGAVVLVTHDRYFLDAIAQRLVELDRGRLASFPGGYSQYLDKKAELALHEERVERNRQNALRREREWLARGPKARGTKQRARIDRAMALESEAEAAAAGARTEVTIARSASVRQGKTVLDLSGVQVVPADGAPPLNEPFDLVIGAGDRIGVVGPNGVGKTSLLRALLAAVEEANGRTRQAGSPGVVGGRVVVGRNTRAAYLDQARASLDDDKSVFEEVRGQGGSTSIELGADGGTVDLGTYLELFSFDGAKQRQKVRALSGGERARVALAKLLRERANLLVLDEPTNDLDLATLAALEAMLVDYEGSVLVVTHDRAFLDRVATAILAFEPRSSDKPARVVRYAGGFTDYIAQRAPKQGLALGGGLPMGDAASRPVATEAGRGKAARAAVTVPKPPKTGLTFAEKLELERIVDAIEAADHRVAELERLFSDPTLYTERGTEVATLRSRLEAARSEAAALMARWEQLEAKKTAGL